MESEARLVMIDYGVPPPELQYEIRGECEAWRVDFAWPDQRVAAEYESIAWHSGRLEMLRDKERLRELQELGWTVIPISRRRRTRLPVASRREDQEPSRAGRARKSTPSRRELA